LVVALNCTVWLAPVAAVLGERESVGATAVVLLLPHPASTASALRLRAKLAYRINRIDNSKGSELIAPRF
jgi:hypothetical protein